MTWWLWLIVGWLAVSVLAALWLYVTATLGRRRR